MASLYVHVKRNKVVWFFKYVQLTYNTFMTAQFSAKVTITKSSAKEKVWNAVGLILMDHAMANYYGFYTQNIDV